MIAAAVRTYLHKQPFLSEALMDGIINYAGLARKMQPELREALGRDVKEGAIVMALKRIAPDYYFQVSKGIKGLLRQLGDLSVRSQIVGYTYQNSSTLLLRQKNILEQVAKTPTAFYSFNQGIYESTLVASLLLDKKISEILDSENLVQKTTDLASITMLLPRENVEISGLYYYLFKQLAWEGINVVEVISTTHEFTVVVDEDEVERSFQILHRLKTT